MPRTPRPHRRSDPPINSSSRQPDAARTPTRASAPPPRQPGGRHELGQNFLVDDVIIDRIVELASASTGPIVEWGAGDGALTLPLGRLGRPLVAVELDPRRADRLRRRVGRHVSVHHGDILRHAPPPGATVVCNVPFHLTTPVLRHLLRSEAWADAVLLTQWEVARKRAGVGGATQLTAQWWPWFEVRLDRRVPSRAFRPVPSVDGGILQVTRRPHPLVLPGERDSYQRWVRAVFTGRGHGIADVLARSGGLPRRAATGFASRHGLGRFGLPRDLDAGQWVEAFALSRSVP